MSQKQSPAEQTGKSLMQKNPDATDTDDGTAQEHCTNTKKSPAQEHSASTDVEKSPAQEHSASTDVEKNPAQEHSASTDAEENPVQKHFTATGIVIDKDCRALMIRHKKLGVWLPPGGHIEPNETPDEAVIREIWEESGVRATIMPNDEDLNAGDCWASVLHTPFAVLCEDIGKKATHFHLDFVYICSADTQSGSANPAEVTDLRWFTLEEVQRLPDDEIYHNAKYLVCKALKKFKGAVEKNQERQ